MIGNIPRALHPVRTPAGFDGYREERMIRWPTALPPLLQKLHALDLEAGGDTEIDFEPYPEFLRSAQNARWFQAWTGNRFVDGAQFRIFGQDGTGGYAALWIAEPARSLEEQPVVFLGSEADMCVVAVDLHEYLWLFAGGVGPYEAINHPGTAPRPWPRFAAFAQRHSRAPAMSPARVLERANAAHPGFVAYIRGLCC